MKVFGEEFVVLVGYGGLFVAYVTCWRSEILRQMSIRESQYKIVLRARQTVKRRESQCH